MISSVMSEVMIDAEGILEMVFRKLGDRIHDRLRGGTVRALSGIPSENIHDFLHTFCGPGNLRLNQ